METEKLFKQGAGVIENVTPHDLIEDWGSYLNDVEVNLKMDPYAWKKYLKDPTGVYTDVLNDFGNFDKFIAVPVTSSWYRLAVRVLVNIALRNYVF